MQVRNSSFSAPRRRWVRLGPDRKRLARPSTMAWRRSARWFRISRGRLRSRTVVTCPSLHTPSMPTGIPRLQSTERRSIERAQQGHGTVSLSPPSPAGVEARPPRRDVESCVDANICFPTATSPSPVIRRRPVMSRRASASRTKSRRARRPRASLRRWVLRFPRGTQAAIRFSSARISIFRRCSKFMVPLLLLDSLLPPPPLRPLSDVSHTTAKRGRRPHSPSRGRAVSP
jgi:hypothetical protein